MPLLAFYGGPRDGGFTPADYPVPHEYKAPGGIYRPRMCTWVLDIPHTCRPLRTDQGNPIYDWHPNPPARHTATPE